MQFLHTADLHIGALRRYSHQLSTDVYGGYLKRDHSGLRSILSLARKKSLPLVIAGDIFHYSTVTVPELNVLLSALVDFRDVDIFMISGNHDYIEPGRTTLRAAYEFSRVLPRLRIVENEIEVFQAPSGEGTFVLVPGEIGHYGDSQSFSHQIGTVVSRIKTRPIVVVAHAAVIGASDDSGYIVGKKGVEISSSKTFNRISYWALGDIHRTQSLQNAPNAWYSGAPWATRFSEDPTTKRILLVNTAKAHRPKAIRIRSTPMLSVSGDLPLKKWPRAAQRPGAAIVRMQGPWAGTDPIPTTVVKITATPRNQTENIEDLEGVREALSVSKLSDPFKGLQGWLVARTDLNENEASAAEVLVRKLTRGVV